MLQRFSPIALVGSLAAAPSALAQQTPAAPLDYGPHAVGFRVIEALDSTRSFRPVRDFRGEPAGESARPVQISVWYPARSVPGARRIPAGAFRLLSHSEIDFSVVLSSEDSARQRDEFLRSGAGFGVDTATAARLWDEPTPAIRDAPPLPGPHPTVLYTGAAGVNDPLLPAYLASHGFVVASYPANGRMTDGSLEYTPNALTLDTGIDDAGFVHSVLRRTPYADARRLAVASFSGGTLPALLWAMRDMQASAFVSIEGWERYRRGADIVSASVHYDPGRIRVPYLMLERAATEPSPQFARVDDVVGALRYASITRVAFRDAEHGDFLSHAPSPPGSGGPTTYATSARTIRLFLQAALARDAGAERELQALAPPSADPFFTIAHTRAIGPVPSEEELYRLAETDPAAALVAYRTAIRVVPGRDLFRESVLTRAAIFASSPDARVTILEIVADAYPASTAARFQLGQALAEMGRPAEAEAAFRAALELVAHDPALEDAGRAQWRERIQAALRRDPETGR